MTDMIERVARAIVAAFPEWPGYPAEPIARAAITAMREPTANVHTSVSAAIRAGNPTELVWCTGIDEALR